MKENCKRKNSEKCIRLFHPSFPPFTGFSKDAGESPLTLKDNLHFIFKRLPAAFCLPCLNHLRIFFLIPLYVIVLLQKGPLFGEKTFLRSDSECHCMQPESHDWAWRSISTLLGGLYGYSRMCFSTFHIVSYYSGTK